MDMDIQHNEHEIRIVTLETEHRKFGLSLDTFGCPENHDRLLKNVLRLLGIGGMIWFFHAQSLWLVPMFLIAATFAGLTELRYFQNEPHELEFVAWR